MHSKQLKQTTMKNQTATTAAPEVNEYDQQAAEFMKATKTRITVRFYDHAKSFSDDKEERDIYMITLRTPASQYTFKFGQSIKNSDQATPPRPYDIFACFTKYDTGTFENFCDEFGYDNDSRAAERTYKAVCRQYNALCRCYTTEQLELMQAIQ